MGTNASPEDTTAAESALDWTIRDSLKQIMPRVARHIAEEIERDDGIFIAVERGIAAELKEQLRGARLSIYLQDKKPTLTMFWSDFADPFEFPLDEIILDLGEDDASLKQQLECADAFIAEFANIKARLQAALDGATAAALPADEVDTLILPPTGNGILIYGPARSGKSINSAALAKHYGKTTVLDDWDWRAGPVPGNAIAFTNDDMVRGSAISIEVAMRAAGLG